MYLLPFWVLNMVFSLLSMQSQKAPGFHQKYLNLCSEDERRSYGFGMTWGRVIKDRILFFGWSIPLALEWTCLMSEPVPSRSVISREWDETHDHSKTTPAPGTFPEDNKSLCQNSHMTSQRSHAPTAAKQLMQTEFVLAGFNVKHFPPASRFPNSPLF